MADRDHLALVEHRRDALTQRDGGRLIVGRLQPGDLLGRRREALRRHAGQHAREHQRGQRIDHAKPPDFSDIIDRRPANRQRRLGVRQVRSASCIGEGGGSILTISFVGARTLDAPFATFKVDCKMQL